MSTNPRAVRRLRTACERAKRTLSSSTQASIEIDSLFEGVDFYTTMTRARFEELNLDLFKKTIPSVEKALTDAKLKKTDIDEVVLVGGSSRIPKVRQLVKDYFGKEPNTGINPDEAIAFGAAVQGGILSGASETEDIVLLDVAPLSLGIETVGGVMSTIIPRNSMIPTKKSQTFSTYQDQQTRVTIKVYEGERSMTKDNRLLGSFDLSGIAPAPRGTPQIEVTFSIDVDGIMHIAASDKGTGSSESLTITRDHNSQLSEEEIARMVREAEENAEADKEVKGKIDTRNKLEGYAYQLKNLAKDAEKGAKLSDEQKASLTEAADEALAFLESNGDASKEELDEAYTKLEGVANPIVGGMYGGAGGAGDGGGAEDMNDHTEL